MICVLIAYLIKEFIMDMPRFVIYLQDGIVLHTYAESFHSAIQHCHDMGYKVAHIVRV